MFVNGSGRNCNRYRGPSIDASYQISVHLDKWFQRRFFRNKPIRNKNCLWRPGLLMDQDNMSNLYRGPSIDASYQVSLHLAKGFQRGRLKREKLTDAKWWQKLTLPLARWAKNRLFVVNSITQWETSCIEIWVIFSDAEHNRYVKRHLHPVEHESHNFKKY